MNGRPRINTASAHEATNQQSMRTAQVDRSPRKSLVVSRGCMLGGYGGPPPATPGTVSMQSLLAEADFLLGSEPATPRTTTGENSIGHETAVWSPRGFSRTFMSRPSTSVRIATMLDEAEAMGVEEVEAGPTQGRAPPTNPSSSVQPSANPSSIMQPPLEAQTQVPLKMGYPALLGGGAGDDRTRRLQPCLEDRPSDAADLSLSGSGGSWATAGSNVSIWGARSDSGAGVYTPNGICWTPVCEQEVSAEVNVIRIASGVEVERAKDNATTMLSPIPLMPAPLECHGKVPRNIRLSPIQKGPLTVDNASAATVPTNGPGGKTLLDTSRLDSLLDEFDTELSTLE